MSDFNIISLLGGLAMFLYDMLTFILAERLFSFLMEMTRREWYNISYQKISG